MKRATQGTILLIQPRTSLLDLKKDTPAMPLSLLYAASCVGEEFPLTFYDERVDGEFPRWFGARGENGYLCVGITAIPGEQAYHAGRLARLARTLVRAPIVWGGKHATLFHEEILQDGLADLVVRGEGEDALRELAKALVGGEPVHRIAGVRGNVPGGEAGGQGPALAAVFDLERISSLPYGMLRGEYLYTKNGKKTSLLETSRGCPYRCTYCYHSTGERAGWKGAGADWVEERVHELRRFRPEVRHVDFVDDNFFVDRRRALAVARRIAQVSPAVTFTSNGGRVKDLLRYERETLRELARCGLDRIDIGVETGSPRIRELIRKEETNEEIFEVCARLCEAGISPWLNLMSGFPGETRKELGDTLRLALRLTRRFPRLYVSPVYVYTPYPGTELYETLRRSGVKVPAYRDLLGMDWNTGGASWLTRRRKRDLSRLYFYSLFLDDKVLSYRRGPLAALALRLFKPLARLRVRTGIFSLPVGKFVFERTVGRAPRAATGE